MAPKGRSVKAKEQAEENGKEKRTRNVKAAFYKDLSDSDDERIDKPDSAESNSEEELPRKKRGAKKKVTPRRKQKGSSESESEFGSSDDDSDKPSKKRQPVRSSLRASKSTSYKDLSNSEEEGEPARSSLTSRKEKQRQQKKTTKDSSNKSEKAEPEDKSPGEEANKSSDDQDDSKSDAETKNSVKKEETVSSEESTKAQKGSTDVKSTNELGEGSKKENNSGKDDGSQNRSTSGRAEYELSDDDDDEEKPETPAKKRGRPKKNERSEPPAKKVKSSEDAPKLNRTESDFKSMDFTSSATTSDGKLWNFKISSWNVAGLKAIVKKNGFDYIEHEKPDIICLQETKCSEKKLPPEAKLEGYHTYWLSGEKEGYAGVALLSKQEPLEVKYGIDVKDFDSDGRVITAEYDKFFLVNAYVPNAGQGLKSLPRRMEWDPAFRAYLKKLDEKKPVILCGDLNVAHTEIDLANPKTNTKSAGFTPQEREGMTELLKEGFVDSFRHKYPEKTGAYTFWTYFQQARARNVGWRLDYFILSERLLPNMCDNVIRSEVYGSDHCPITLLLNI